MIEATKKVTLETVKLVDSLILETKQRFEVLKLEDKSKDELTINHFFLVIYRMMNSKIAPLLTGIKKVTRLFSVLPMPDKLKIGEKEIDKNEIINFYRAARTKNFGHLKDIVFGMYHQSSSPFNTDILEKQDLEFFSIKKI